MPYPDLMEGDVFFLNLTDHTGISANTMKGPHRIAIVMNPRKLANHGHKTIVCVPIESAHTGLWDSVNNRPRIQSHHCPSARKYQELHHDSLAKCEQIYTLNREFFTDYRLHDRCDRSQGNPAPNGEYHRLWEFLGQGVEELFSPNTLHNSIGEFGLSARPLLQPQFKGIAECH